MRELEDEDGRLIDPRFSYRGEDVEAITHADRPDDLVRKGRDIERRVLAEAVRLHLQDRVFMNGNKTIVFRD